ncbi:putative ABC transporter permease [Jingyaoa shaoxingensis]|uniref:ABC transporter permease n=1 Tax=Jingyaoa shaoxingensis TaxID=2763671 RepID=A0ABR7N944_9FIRM|nr:putative ABC transporter permease [Jingyaoa shaoxingensis]MBC8572910.1 putative ABC transporter permease [Jingyaoa shaoxingensis]
MWISKYFVYFVIFSCMGWIYESIFCTVKSGSWQNRGFLYGPVCPIYGVGAATIMALVDWYAGQNQGQVNYTWWQVFLVAFFGSIVLEYVTSWGLEKLFHAYWWDYSDVPLNINGRVCFPASVGFGVAGLLVIYVIAPATKDATQWITPILMELFSLIFMALLAADATLTVSALTGFERNVAAMEEALNQHMEQFVSTVQQKSQAAGEVLGEKKLAASERLAEERMRFTKERLESITKRMGSGHRAALNRVKGFRRYGTETERKSKIRGIFHQTVKRYKKGGDEA